VYLRIWEYEVAPDAVERFAVAYAADGDWARLFARSEGFLGTELLRDTHTGVRFATIDRWRDEADWTAFLGRWEEAYQALDRSLAPLTRGQTLLLEGTSPGR
jgi:heme-degrading monooxygenase HmoA